MTSAYIVNKDETNRYLYALADGLTGIGTHPYGNIGMQREDLFWNCSLADPDDFGGKEVTGTSLFIYGIAWCINHNVQGFEQYRTLRKPTNVISRRYDTDWLICLMPIRSLLKAKKREEKTRRHANLFPELKQLLSESGVRNILEERKKRKPRIKVKGEK